MRSSNAWGQEGRELDGHEGCIASKHLFGAMKGFHLALGVAIPKFGITALLYAPIHNTFHSCVCFKLLPGRNTILEAFTSAEVREGALFH